MIAFSTGKLKKNLLWSWTNKKFDFFFQLLKLRKIGETNW